MTNFDNNKRNKKNKKNTALLTVLILLLVLVLGAAAGVGIYALKKSSGEGQVSKKEAENKTSAETKEKSETSDKSNESDISDKSKKTDSSEESKDNESSEKSSSAELAEKASSSEKATGNGHIVCIDPGHQTSGDSSTEPNGPGSSVMKARVTGGTHGNTSGLSEYELNLIVSLQLEQELKNRGYTVYMTRSVNDVNISNKERAEYATSVGADIYIRIHANGSESTSTNGALALVPSSSNPYVSYLADSSYTLAECVLDSYCAACGMANLGVQTNDTMTGTNWATMPVVIMEMGFMSNPSDDANMADAAYQVNMVNGMANGIDQYFGE